MGCASSSNRVVPIDIEIYQQRPSTRWRLYCHKDDLEIENEKKNSLYNQTKKENSIFFTKSSSTIQQQQPQVENALNFPDFTDISNLHFSSEESLLYILSPELPNQIPIAERNDVDPNGIEAARVIVDHADHEVLEVDLSTVREINL